MMCHVPQIIFTKGAAVLEMPVLELLSVSDEYTFGAP